MKHLLSLVWMAMSLTCLSQDLMWESGVVITKEKEILVGSLVYYSAHDAVLLKQSDGLANFFPSCKISSFRFYDSKADINRQFINIGAASSSRLLEIVLNGSVKLLRKMKFRNSELATADNAEDFFYYVWMDNDLTPLQQFRSKVLPVLLKRFPDELASFVSSRKNKKQTDIVAIQILKEYNRLQSKPHLVASID
jgi:hypothetical protein